jgi:hypothetical protein
MCAVFDCILSTIANAFGDEEETATKQNIAKIFSKFWLLIDCPEVCSYQRQSRLQLMGLKKNEQTTKSYNSWKSTMFYQLKEA